MVTAMDYDVDLVVNPMEFVVNLFGFECKAMELSGAYNWFLMARPLNFEAKTNGILR